MNLEVNLGKLKLKNPVVLASGTFDRSITNHIDVSKLGAITTKTITLKPREGNPLPHIIKSEFGWLNSVGLKNPGVDKYLSEELPFWQEKNAEIVCSIGGDTETEYINLAKRISKTNINAIEVNVSCPNVKNGLSFSDDPKKLTSLIKKIRKVYKKTLIVKLSVDIVLTNAKNAKAAGADCLTLINTIRGLAINPKNNKFYFAKEIGGYSGDGIKPIALRCVYEVYKMTKCDIIGGGGISSTQDAIDFLKCGAKAVFVGSGNYLDPKISIKILNGLRKIK